MKKINLILIGTFILVFSMFCVSALEYKYIYENGFGRTVSFGEYDRIRPLSEYDGLEQCGNFFAREDLENIGGLNMNIINTDCEQSFLYNIINYLNSDEEIEIIYAQSGREEEKQLVQLLAEIFNKTIYSDFDISENKPIQLLVGDSNIKIKKELEFFDLEENETMIYIKEEGNQRTIAIVGYNSRETSKFLRDLFALYFDEFKNYDCIIIEGCRNSYSDTNFDQEIDLQEIMVYTKKYTLGEVIKSSFISEIGKWVRGYLNY